MAKTEKKKVLNLYLPVSTVDSLREYAQDTERTIASSVRFLLKERLETEGYMDNAAKK